MPNWYELKLRSRPRGEWRYAHYIETPSERSDGKWFEAIYFRDVAGNRFGKLEFHQLMHRDFRDLATKIDSDRAYRESLLSDDPELPTLWRKR